MSHLYGAVTEKEHTHSGCSTTFSSRAAVRLLEPRMLQVELGRRRDLEAAHLRLPVEQVG